MQMISKEQASKLECLRSLVKSEGRLAVAFSGGVDSTLLLAVAYEQLGENACAITNDSTLIPQREFEEAVRFCEARGVRQLVLESDELAVPEIRANPKNRCYICKRAMFERIIALAEENGYPTVAEGSNVDDLSDYRPGHQAIRELGVKSPLLEAGLTKQDIRDISLEMNLPTWSKQSFACLASRFPYGSEITREGLAQVAQAEQFLLDLGVSYSRVRIHGDLARIEVLSGEIDLALEHRERIAGEFKRIGFAYVSLDLLGYRTGSMNETL